MPELHRVAADEFIVPTRRAFLERLDLTRPALTPVRDALKRDDVDAAGRAYIAHLRQRPLDTPLIIDWARMPRDPARSHKIADDCLRGKLWDGYNVYDIPPTGIDWYDCPLFCLPRFPVFEPLLEAFHDTGDTRYLRFIVDHSLQFIAAYNVADYAGKHCNEGMRSHYHVGPPTWWCLLPNRQEAWTRAIEVLRRHDCVSDEELLTILHRMLQEARWFATQVPYWLALEHNAASYYVKVYGHVCWLFDDFTEAGNWRKLNAEWLAKYLDTAFYPDGLFKELTTGYASSVVEHVAAIGLVLRDEPAMRARRERMVQLLTTMAALSGPTRRTPSMGDIYGQLVRDTVSVPVAQWLNDDWLNWAILALRDPSEQDNRRQKSNAAGPQFVHSQDESESVASLASKISSSTKAPGHTQPRNEMEQRHLIWPAKASDAWGGYYTMRSDWSHDARFMLIDGGPWGTAHQHMDKLSFVLSAFGADFIVDPCCTLYANNEPGARLSTLHAGFLHNTITIDGVDEYVQPYANAKPDAKDSLHHSAYWQTHQALDNRWEHGEGYSLFVGRFDFAPLKPVRWERRVVFVNRAYWWIQDVITGDQPSAKIEQNFQFEEDVRVALTGNGARAEAFNGASLSVIALENTLKPTIVIGEEAPRKTYSTQYGAYSKPDAMGHGRGWVARFNNRIIPAPALLWAGEAKLPCVLTILLVPRPAGDGDEVMPPMSSVREGDATKWILHAGSGWIEINASMDSISVRKHEPAVLSS